MTRRCDILYAALFLAALALVVPVDFALHALGATPPSEEWQDRPVVATLETLRTGDAGPALERSLSDRSFLTHGSAAWYRAGVATWLGRRPQTAFQLDELLGMDKSTWLFFPGRREAFTSAERERATDIAVEKIVSAAREMEKAGVKLVVQLIPDRARLYADKAYEDGLPPEKARFLPDVVRRLREAGLAVQDLTPAFAHAREEGLQVFYRDDHHWTFRGAERAAQEAVALVAPFLPASVDAPPVHTVHWDATVAHGSSLLRKLGFPTGSRREQVVIDDTQPCARFEPPWEDTLFQPPPADGLILLTSSYGRFGSVPFLRNALLRDLGWSARDGKGATFAPSQFIAQYLNDPDLPRPAVALWNITEYNLYQSIPDGPYRFPYCHAVREEPLGWQVESAPGLAPMPEGGWTFAREEAQWVLSFDQPVRNLRLMIAAQDLPGFKTRLAPAGQTPLLVIDQAGIVPYDFILDAPVRRVVLDLTAQGTGGVVTLYDAVAWQAERPG